MTIAEILDYLNKRGHATTDIDIEAYKQETDFFDKNTGDIIAVYHSTRGTLTIY